MSGNGQTNCLLAIAAVSLVVFGACGGTPETASDPPEKPKTTTELLSSSDPDENMQGIEQAGESFGLQMEEPKK